MTFAFVRKKVVQEVVHIGHLSQARADRRQTTSGPCIAVCQDEEKWRRIGGLNGPAHTLKSRMGEWVNAMDFDHDDMQNIIAWMVMRKYMKRAAAWEVLYEDPEIGDPVSTIVSSLEKAAALVGRTLAEEEAAMSRGEGCAMEVEGYELTRIAISKLGGWPDPMHWTDASLILYTREVIMMKHEFIVGLWWDEVETRAGDLAPYGLLFPERAHHFHAEDEDGYEVPLKEAFPDLDILNGRRPEEANRKLVFID